MNKYTVEQADLELEKILSGENPATLDELNRIFENLDVTDSKANADAKTVLYSGMDVGELANNPNNRMLNNTEAFKFLNKIQFNDTFNEVWEKIVGSKPDWKSDYSGEIDKFIGGEDGSPRTKGAWDIISRNFVEEAPLDSEIKIYAGDNI